MQNKYTVFILLALIIIMQLLLRIPFLNEPLERDEGLYGYMGQRILAGEVPYRDVFDHKPPTVYYIYALIIKFFGPTMLAIRCFGAMFSLLNTLAVFAVGYLLFGRAGGLLSALLYAIFSGGPMIQGTSSNTETFMVLPMTLALACFIVASRGKSWKWLLAAGFFSGLAVMIKQVAFMNFIVLAVFTFWEPEAKPACRQARRLGSQKEPRGLLAGSLLISGFLIVPAFWAWYFFSQGALADLINCAFLINKAYLQASPAPFFFFDPKFGLYNVWILFSRENGALWLLSAIAVYLILKKERTGERYLLLSWSLFSFLGITAGTLFFGHYFIQLIPSLCLLSALALIGLFSSRNNAAKVFTAAGLALLLVINMYYLIPFYFVYNPYQISLIKQSTNDFNVAMAVADSLKKIMKPNDRVFVWAAEPEVYFYLNQKAPGRFPFYYYWMSRTRLFGKEPLALILEDVKKIKPRFVVRSSYNPPAPAIAEWVMKNYNPRDDLTGLKVDMTGWRVGERK